MCDENLQQILTTKIDERLIKCAFIFLLYEAPELWIFAGVFILSDVIGFCPYIANQNQTTTTHVPVPRLLNK